MRRRRGVSTVQWCVVAAVLTLVVLVGVRLLGTSTNTRMGNIASGVADPTKLKAMNTKK